MFLISDFFTGQRPVTFFFNFLVPFFLQWTRIKVKNQGSKVNKKKFKQQQQQQTPYPTRWGRLHGSTSAIMFYQVPYFYPNH